MLMATLSDTQVDVMGPQIDVMGPSLEVMGSQVDVMGAPVDIMGAPVDIMGPALEVMGPAVDIMGPDIFGLDNADVWAVPWYWKYNPWRPVFDWIYPSAIKADDSGTPVLDARAARYVWTAVPVMGISALHTYVGRPLGAVLGAVHGWKRTRSAGFTVLWSALGLLAPVITTTTAMVQGFGQPKGK